MAWLGMMTLAASLAGVSATAAQVVHRDATYDVTYHAQTQVRNKPVGMTAGPRMSTARCERTMTIVVERHIQSPGAQVALVHRLPMTHTWRDSTPGACTAQSRLSPRRTAQVEQLLAQAVRTDRPAALAAIDAAHALASR